MEKLATIFLIFLIYGFVGWIIEVIFSYLVETHKLVNRGFLIGPIIPIYGIGAVFLTTFLYKYRNDWIVVFSLSVLACSILEYTTSFLMEKIFKNRWWDYSYMKFNINGRICLETMIPFGIAAIFLIKYAHPQVLNLVNLLPPLAKYITAGVLAALLLADIITSFNIIITLKNISSSIKTDSTEIITKKVKESLLSKGILFKRLVWSFPNMMVFNKLTVLKNRINFTKRFSNKFIKHTEDQIDQIKKER